MGEKGGNTSTEVLPPRRRIPPQGIGIMLCISSTRTPALVFPTIKTPRRCQLEVYRALGVFPQNVVTAPHLPPSTIASCILPFALISARYALAQTLARVQNKPYEYVTVDSPHLASVSEDGRAFAEHLASQEGAALTCAIEEDCILVYAYCSFSSVLLIYSSWGKNKSRISLY